MRDVSFPGLGLSFTLDPVAFTVFGWQVHWYGVIIASGFALAVLFCSGQTKKFGFSQEDFLDMLVVAVPSAIVGARIYYVLFYLDLYRLEGGGIDWARTIRIHDGGIAIYGAVIGAVIGAWLIMRYKKKPFLAMADVGAMGLLIGQCIGRWGNFVNVEAFGGETSLPWRMGIQQKLSGAFQYTEVHPTFLYESLWNLVGFILLVILLKKGMRKFDGQLFFTYIAWYGIGRFWIEGLRTDSLMFFGTGLRVSQMLALVSAIVAIGYIAYRLKKKPAPKQLYFNQQPQSIEGERE